MADIELVIKMPEDDYKRFGYEYREEATISKRINDIILDAFCNGTLLPKGHGRLIDADKIANEVNARKDNWDRHGNEYESGRYESYDCVVDMIDDAPTIIEADKKENEATV